MKKLIVFNPHVLIFHLLPVALLMRLDSVTANLRHGDIVGASLELFNVIFGSHWHKYQNRQQSRCVPPNLKWFGNLILSSLLSLTMLTSIA
ncbi:hypothetical protein [Dyadobacter frigoris]|uniref:Uncharacterized protein n=1 Tax=Dyadobacter frigoris TaxID=2576211 RepID=A0A4U6D0T8_9BACT|nr:hypothetical protein [Dyadobacter frigoris]TKT89348.1 hypothetical protein FDK13_23645 [Dyadobacter frigoris]GLU55516.1 hypothetical protein Dfri01_49770 [Dyadobacter frigoris]